MSPLSRNGHFCRDLLPTPREFFASEGVDLRGNGEWAKGLCVFHDDHHPSLSVNLETGYAICWACGWRGDMLQFYMDLHGVDFACAAKALGAWEAQR